MLTHAPFIRTSLPGSAPCSQLMHHCTISSPRAPHLYINGGWTGSAQEISRIAEAIRSG